MSDNNPDNVVDIFNYIDRTQLSSFSSVDVVTDDDIHTFLKILRRIQSSSISQEANIQINHNNMIITTNNITSHDNKSDDVTISRSIVNNSTIQCFLPLLDFEEDGPNDNLDDDINLMIKDVKQALEILPFSTEE